MVLYPEGLRLQRGERVRQLVNVEEKEKKTKKEIVHSKTFYSNKRELINIIVIKY